MPTISPIHTAKIHSKRLKAQHKELNRMKSGCTICGHRRAPEPVFLSLVKCLYTLTLTRQPFSTKSALPQCANRREAKADWTRKHDAMTHWLCQNKFSKCVCVCVFRVWWRLPSLSSPVWVRRIQMSSRPVFLWLFPDSAGWVCGQLLKMFFLKVNRLFLNVFE